MTALIHSLRFRILLLVLVCILPALALIFHTGLEQKRVASETAKQEALRLIREIDRDQESLILSARHLLSTVAQVPCVRASDLTSCRELFSNLLRNNPSYTAFGILAPNGDLLFSAPEAGKPVNMSDRPHFSRALSTRDFAVGDYYTGPVTGNELVSLLFPVLNATGEVDRILLTALHVSSFNELASKWKLAEGQVLAFVDRNGKILARYPDPEHWTGRPMPDSGILKTALSQEEGMAEGTGIDGIPRLYAFARLGQTPASGFVYVGFPKAAVEEQADAVLTRNLMALGLVSLVGLLGAWGLGHLFIVARVSALATGAQRLASGDLGARMQWAPNGSELDRLAHALDGMAEALEKREAERARTETALREANAILDSFFRCSPVPIAALDPSGIVTAWNPSAEALFGWTTQEVLGRRSPIVRDQEQEEFRILYGRVLAGEQLTGIEITRERKDESPIELSLFTAPLRDGRGKLTGIVSIMVDVTERKRMEQRLAESEAKYRSLVEEVPAVKYVTDLREPYKASYVSPQIASMLGYTQDEWLSQPELWMRLLHPEDRTRVLQAFQHLVTEGGALTTEYRVLARDGREIWVRDQATVLTGADGAPVLLQGIIIDVTDRKVTELALERLLRRHELILASTWEGILGIDREGNVTFINPSAARMLGYKVEELQGRNGHATWHHTRSFGQPFPWEECPFHATLQNGSEVHLIDDYFWRKDGTGFPVEVTSTPIFENERIAGSVLTFWDITDRKKAAEELIASEARFRAFLDNNPALAFLKDEKGRYIYVNKIWERYWKLTPIEWWGRTDEEIFPPGLAGKLSASDAAALAEDNPMETLEVVKGPSGARLHWLSVKFPVRDASGERFLGCVALDVTEQKEAEEAIRRLEARNALFVEESPIGIAIVQDGRYVYANPALVRIFGCESPDGIVDRLIDEFLIPEEHDAISSMAMAMDMSTDPRKLATFLEVKGRKEGGAPFDAVVWPRLIAWHGEPAALVFVADTTEERSLRAQLVQSQKMEAIGTLAGGLAHDFNNLLTVVLGYSELLLLDDTISPQSRADLDKILRSARSGADLIKRLLTFSRKAEIQVREMNLNDQIEQLQKMLFRTLPKMIGIELILDRNLAIIDADPNQLEQVLMNLAVNSGHAMPTGGKLTIQTENVRLDEEYCRMHLGAEPGGYVLVTVSDTGCGMDKQTQDRIFEPFFTTKKEGEGTGLGLAMVYGIVKQHGGSIKCYSEPGHGTAFTIYLPVAAGAAGNPAAVPLTDSKGGGETILLVDDEEDILDLGKRILGRAGYTILTANNSPEALELYQKAGSMISLVLLDLIMPQTGGKECLEELLKIDPKAKVLIASGFAPDGQIAAMTACGAKGFIRKPYQSQELLEVVREVLDSA